MAIILSECFSGGETLCKADWLSQRRVDAVDGGR